MGQFVYISESTGLHCVELNWKCWQLRRTEEEQPVYRVGQHRKEPEGEHLESISAPKSPSTVSILRTLFEGILPQNTIWGGKQDICLLGHRPLLLTLIDKMCGWRQLFMILRQNLWVDTAIYGTKNFCIMWQLIEWEKLSRLSQQKSELCILQIW